MDNLANLVGMKAEDKGLELLFDAAPDLPTNLVGDPLRLGQVLLNLEIMRSSLQRRAKSSWASQRYP